MPILATGNRSTFSSNDGGFSLVELLAVLAILSLMVGAVVLNLPEPRSATDKASEQMAAQLSAFLDQGAIRGEMRAIGADQAGLTLYRHDGLRWSETGELNWPDAARPRLELNEETVDLTDEVEPLLLFEPYGGVPDFAIILSAPDAEYSLSANARGQVVREVVR